MTSADEIPGADDLTDEQHARRLRQEWEDHMDAYDDEVRAHGGRVTS